MGAVAQNGGPALQIDSLGLPARVLEGRAEGPVTHGLGSAAGIGGGDDDAGAGGRGQMDGNARDARRSKAGRLLRFGIRHHREQSEIKARQD